MATVFGTSPSEAAFFDEIINVYHPDYSIDSTHAKRKNVARALRGNFAVCQILEETVEARSHELTPKRPLINVNDPGMDFDDGSDLKTCSLNFYVTRGYEYAKTQIASLGNKKGSLRVILYNSVLERVEFYFMTYEQWSPMVVKNNSINLTASCVTGVIKRIAEYRVDTFDQLVRAK